MKIPLRKSLFLSPHLPKEETTTATQPATLYDKVGGHETFHQLTGHFYDYVAKDPILRPMYDEDLAPAQERLTLFLEQYFGGAKTYSQLRGHPRLRMRHIPFTIDSKASQAWLAAMDYALTQMRHTIRIEEEVIMRNYFSSAANMLINTPEQSS